ncbi:unnamed protein product [Linum tenue]|uniref:Uncharacterized protein n=1 Tax=Linum tenue TaxID=586396 RepID=A0AAV0MP79_9ROSI|nr:unnamed protein product [Linum tenue]
MHRALGFQRLWLAALFKEMGEFLELLLCLCARILRGFLTCQGQILSGFYSSTLVRKNHTIVS